MENSLVKKTLLLYIIGRIRIKNKYFIFYLFKELAYGGWVAPNIYYLGYAGVVSVNGVRIAGLSGIYKVRVHFFFFRKLSMETFMKNHRTVSFNYPPFGNFLTLCIFPQCLIPVLSGI